jgi:low temperature requirement protein LtrA
VIIALGESIVVTGATTSELQLDLARVVAFAVAFLSTAAFWWLYFNYVAQIAQRRLELAGLRRTQLARDGYTYLHVVLITGVIVSAVGDELVIARPTEVLPGREVAALVAGPAIYLLAHALFRLRMSGSLSRKRLAGAVACAATGGIGAFAPALVVAALLLAILIAVIVSERISGRRRARRGEPAPLERLDAAAEEQTGAS